jgi:hypothetical protein
VLFDDSVSPRIEAFYTGLGGWADEQLLDGTVVWTDGQEVHNETGWRRTLSGVDPATTKNPRPTTGITDRA